MEFIVEEALKTDTQIEGMVGNANIKVIGVGGASNAEHGEWQIPYGALIPQTIDNVLAAGRCISCDLRMADLVRLIPNCFVIGHAAGVAAAVAVRDHCKPRDADINKIQKILRQQEAYLG